MTQPEPVRKSLLPSTPPPEWQFTTVFGARAGSAGCLLVPGDTGDTVIRRRVTYSDWEPVRPDHWADEPDPAVSGALSLPETQPQQPDSCHIVEVDGTTVLVRGGGPITDDERSLLADAVRAARRQAEAEQQDGARR